MTPGRLLQPMSRLCSDQKRTHVLEALVADLQHQWTHSPRIGGLLHGYVAFWMSFVWCFAKDATSPESREFRHRAAAAFLVAVGATVALEWVLMHGSLTGRFLTMHAPYFFWRARNMTFTLCFGVPLAMFPALLHARTRTKRLTPAAGVMTIAVGTLLTIASSGWFAPAIERWLLVQSAENFARHAGPHVYVEPLHPWLDGYAEAKSWPELIRGVVTGPVHRYPGYPRLVAEEDKSWHDHHWQEIDDRIFVVALGVLVALLGWTLGARGRRTAAATIGWWLVLSAIVIEGQYGGRLLPLMAISAMLATTAFRTVRLKRDTTSCPSHF
jgi:hypothetical protein